MESNDHGNFWKNIYLLNLENGRSDLRIKRSVIFLARNSVYEHTQVNNI